MRILIAEDDLTSRTMLSVVLKKTGHETVETTNGLEALEALEKSDAPEIAILDWMMPIMDGVEVIRRIRAKADGPQPHIIMLTTKSDKADIVAALEAGADDYLVKPFHPAELRARVEVGRRLTEMRSQMTEKIRDLRLALEDIRNLQSILPICMHCKQIRNDKGYWENVEAYISRHSGTLFSHGICPACAKTYYPDILPAPECSDAP